MGRHGLAGLFALRFGGVGVIGADLVGGRQPLVAEPAERAKSVASPMSAVMDAIQLPTGRSRQ